MQVIGFNLTKIAGEKHNPQLGKISTSTKIHFEDIQKENVALLKDDHTLKISFQYNINYDAAEQKKEEKRGEIVMHGDLMLKVDETESKNLIKAWKKRELPADVKVPLYNVILKKCTPKAMALQDQIGLPLHPPIPKLTKQQ